MPAHPTCVPAVNGRRRAWRSAASGVLSAFLFLLMLLVTVHAASAAPALDASYANYSGIFYIQRHNVSGRLTMDKECRGEVLPSLVQNAGQGRRWCTSRMAVRNPLAFNVTIGAGGNMSHYLPATRQERYNLTHNKTVFNHIPIASSLYILNSADTWVPLTMPVTLKPGINWFMLAATKTRPGDIIEWGIRLNSSFYNTDVDPFFSGAESQGASAMISLGTTIQTVTTWNGTNIFIDRFENYTSGSACSTLTHWAEVAGTCGVNNSVDENGNNQLAANMTNAANMSTAGTFSHLVTATTKAYLGANTGEAEIGFVRSSDGTEVCMARANSTSFAMNNGSSTVLDGAHAASAGTWYWLRADVSNSTCIGAWSPNGQNWTLIGANGNGIPGAYQVQIGCRDDTGNCSFDDIRIREWPDTRSIREGLIMAVGFDTGNASIFLDGRGFMPIASDGNLSRQNDGVFGNGMNFSGLGARIGTTAGNTQWRVNETGVSACYWMRPQTAAPAATMATIELHATATYTMLHWITTAGAFQYLYQNESDNTLVGPTVVTSWQHVCATYDATNGNQSLYINGSLYASQLIGTNKCNAAQDNPCVEGITAGERGVNGNNDYNGSLDELMVWSRPITPGEANTVFTYGRSGDLMNITSTDGLTVSYLYSDAGGTAQQNVTLDWFKNDILNQSYVTNPVANANITANITRLGNFSVNDTWYVRLLSCDTGGECDYAWSNAVVIASVVTNAAPTVTLNAPATGADFLTNSSAPSFNVTADDPDGDSMTMNITLNGTIINRTTGVADNTAFFYPWPGNISGDCLACPWNATADDTAGGVTTSATRTVDLDIIPYNTSIEGYANATTVTDTAAFMLFTHHNYSFSANIDIVRHGSCNATFRSVNYAMSFDSTNLRWNSSGIGPLAFGDADSVLYSCVNPTNTSVVNQSEILNVTDALAPGISYQGQTRANNTFANITSFTVNITVVDNSTPTRGNVTVYNGTANLPLESINSTDGENTAAVSEFLQAGAVIILNVTQADRRGNVNTSVRRVFFIDGTAPDLNNFSWPSTLTTGATLRVRVNVTDNMDGNGSTRGVIVELRRPDGTLENLTASSDVVEGFTHSASLEASSVGRWNLTGIYTNDSASNRKDNVSLTLAVTVSNQPSSPSGGGGGGGSPLSAVAQLPESFAVRPGEVDALCVLFPWHSSGRTCSVLVGGNRNISDCNPVGTFDCRIDEGAARLDFLAKPGKKFAELASGKASIRSDDGAFVTLPVRWRIINLRYALPTGRVLAWIPREIAFPWLFSSSPDGSINGVMVWPAVVVILTFGLRVGIQFLKPL